MLSEETMGYFRLSGARSLLSVFASTGIPGDAGEWQSRLHPVLRGLVYAQKGGGRTLYEVAAQLRQAADLFDADPSGGGGREELRNLPRAVPAECTSTTLRAIASHVEQWYSGSREEYYRPPLTAEELLLRFPRFRQYLTIYFGQDGLAVSDGMQGASVEEGIRMLIEEVHPACVWELPGLAAEAYEALALFQNHEVSLDRFFSMELGGGSGSADFVEFLPMLAQACIGHLAEAHPPVWDKR
ncbi:hypothetical protein [Streptomyces sp. NPDC008141]|uniref:hypothetical protein n=1 Tax=Streptomyces sp. NPDC008141 TaxID=3364815 RepID=UPI0036E641CC